MNKFLKCIPTVFVVGDEYEILVIANTNGLIYLEIDGKIYHEKNSGVLHTERNAEKIHVPQIVLDKAKKYKVCFRESIERKSCFSELGEVQSIEFKFAPIVKTENIHIYDFSDIHAELCKDNGYNAIKKCISYFKEDLDLLICNGDVREFRDIDDVYGVFKFLGEISKGKIPVIYARGNHETRGCSNIAETYNEFCPENNGDFYYQFSVGNLHGIVLDWGEDKYDSHVVYGGVNDFSAYRLRQVEFLKNIIKPNDDKWFFCISHIIPAQMTKVIGNDADIDRDIAEAWNKELDRLDIQFMLCGHMHSQYILNSNDRRNILSHKYPVFVISHYPFSQESFENINRKDKNWAGAAIVLNTDAINVKYTDNETNVLASYYLKRNSFNITQINNDI